MLSVMGYNNLLKNVSMIAIGRQTQWERSGVSQGPSLCSLDTHGVPITHFYGVSPTITRILLLYSWSAAE